MNIVNSEPENRVLSQNVFDVGAIHGVMTQKQETLKCIDREMEQLVKKRKGIEEDIVRLGIAVAQLAPYISRTKSSVVYSF